MTTMLIKLINSLEKVFPDKEPSSNPHTKQTCLIGEIVNFQLALYNDTDTKTILPVSIKSELDVNVYKVKNIPSDLPCYNHSKDDNYLSYSPGLYPDLLEPIENNISLIGGRWHSIWIEAVSLNNSGSYNIKIDIGNESAIFNINVINAKLPKQKLIYTQWMHCDCLATYYNVSVFSKKHWELIDNFQKNQNKYGANMILTPVLTPPLDTLVGAERPTVQLVDIEVKNGEYFFSYKKLRQFVKLSIKNNYKYFEISHPFTQWGAKCAPKVMATVDGEYKRIFGWETSATSDEYIKFIRQFMISLKEELKNLNIFNNCYFHISDEPTKEHLESYEQALNILKDIYADCNVMDALSNYDYYENGLVANPIPASNHIEPFIENNVKDLWTYYCCSQNIDVSNKFFAMPSSRNRIIAEQLYKFDIVGFLHWGYNFYYSQFSVKEINPFCVTDADGAFPSGDAFSVYPGENGKPLPSIRQLVFNEALQDLRAFELLEKLTDKQTVMSLIEKNEEITFKKYPKQAEYILNLREKVNKMIAQNI